MPRVAISILTDAFSSVPLSAPLPPSIFVKKLSWRGVFLLKDSGSLIYQKMYLLQCYESLQTTLWNSSHITSA